MIIKINGRFFGYVVNSSSQSEVSSKVLPSAQVEVIPSVQSDLTSAQVEVIPSVQSDLPSVQSDLPSVQSEFNSFDPWSQQNQEYEQIYKDISIRLNKYEFIAKSLIASSVLLTLIFNPFFSFAYAAIKTGTIAAKMKPILNLIQEFALPIGTGVGMWGMIEIILGNPNGMKKVKYSILGYIGVYIIPYIFETIKAALS